MESNDRYSTQGLEIYQGIDGASSEASVRDGYVLEAENVDLSESGVIQKRLGFKQVGGDLPIRVKSWVGNNLELDSQPVVTITCNVYPFGKEGVPDYVNTLISEYHLSLQQFQSTFCILESNINLLEETIFLQSEHGAARASFKLSDTLYVVPNYLLGDIVTNETTVTLTVYKGLLLSKQSGVHSYEYDGVNLKVFFTEPIKLQVGSRVIFDSLYKLSSLELVTGIVSEVTSSYVVIAGTGELEPRVADTGISYALLNIYYVNTEYTSVKVSTELTINTKITGLLNINQLQTEHTSPERIGLFWAYGLGVYPPTLNLIKHSDNLLAISQNWAFSWDTSDTSIQQPSSYQISEDLNLKIKRGFCRIPLNIPNIKVGDLVEFPNLDSELLIADPKQYLVHDVTGGLVIQAGIPEGILKLPSKSRVVFTTTRNYVVVNSFITPGSSIELAGVKVQVIGVFQEGSQYKLKLSKEVTYSSLDRVYIDTNWSPINFAGGVLYPYTGLNPSVYCLDMYKITSTEFSDRTYLSTEEGGIWRFNGRNLTSMRFTGPGMPLLRRLIDVPGSLPAVSSPEGKVASEVIITVNYVWEDFDGKLVESTYINQEDLVIRPQVTESGDAEQIEVCVPTLPEGLGIPATEVKIRVYSGEVGVDTELYMIAEANNNPNLPSVSITIGDRYTRYKTNVADIAMPTVPGINDSPMIAPRCQGVSSFGSNLVAYNTLTEPMIEISSDRIFKDEGDFVTNITSIEYKPTIGDSYLFQGLSDTVGLLPVDSKPQDGLLIEEFQYLDTSNYVHFNYPGSELIINDFLPQTLVPSKEAQRGLITVLNWDKAWSIDFNSEVFIPATRFPSYYSGRQRYLSNKKQQEESFFADVNPKTPILHFYELYKSKGNISGITSEIVPTIDNSGIVISGGKPYLTIPRELVKSMCSIPLTIPGSPPTSDFVAWITRFIFRIHFWNEQDETLGNFVEVSTGKVLSWNKDIVFKVTASNGLDSIVLPDVQLFPIAFLSTNPSIPADGIQYKLSVIDFNNFTNVRDVLHLEGLSHGSYSLFCCANASSSYETEEASVSFVYLGDSQEGFVESETSPVNRGRYHKWGLNLPLKDTPYYKHTDMFRPRVNNHVLAVINLSTGDNTTLYNSYTDGDVVKVKLFDSSDFPNRHEPAEGMINLNQEATLVNKDFFTDTNYPTRRFMLLRLPRAPQKPYTPWIAGDHIDPEVPGTSRLLFNSNTNYAQGYVYKQDFRIEDTYFELPLKLQYNDWSMWVGDFGSDREVGDWVFVILAGMDVNEVYLEYSGWFRLAEKLSVGVTNRRVRLFKDKTNPPKGFNTLYYGAVFGGNLPEYRKNFIPIMLPKKAHSVGRELDYAYPMFSRTEDEGNNPINSFVARFAHAINSVVGDKVSARWGAAPNGDFLSDVYPNNGFQIVPKTLIDRYQELLRVKSLASETVSAYAKNTVNITEEMYRNPTDTWKITIDGEPQEYIRAWGVNRQSNRTGVFTTASQTSIELTYSDSKEISTIKWTISVTDSDTRLPVFGFRNLERLGAEDNEPITGSVRWQDTLIFSKPSSLWAVMINKTVAEKQRIQVSEGSVSGQMVATESEIYFVGTTGVWVTTGSDTKKVEELTRYFRERVLPLGNRLRLAASSYDNLSKSIYLGIPYTLEEGNYPNARFKSDLKSSSWSIDTNLYSSSYVYIAHEAFFSSYLGNVYRMRDKRDIEAYSDAHEGIRFKLRTRYTDTESAFKVKFYRNLYFLLGEQTESYVNIGIATDFKKAISNDYIKLNIKPDKFGTKFGSNNFGGSCYLTDFRVSTPPRFSHLSIQIDNSDTNPVEVFAIFLEGMRVTGKTKKEEK